MKPGRKCHKATGLTPRSGHDENMSTSQYGKKKKKKKKKLCELHQNLTPDHIARGFAMMS